MSGPLVAVIDLNVVVMRLLAVLGGAGLGYLLIGGILYFAGRFVLRKKLPQFVPVVLRGLGALVGGLLVWYWLTGTGTGLGGGGGWWPFGGRGTADGNGGASRPAEPPPKPPAPAETARGAAVEVVMLGGQDVREQRFYKIEGEPRACTFGELTELVVQRRQQSPAVKVLRIVVRQDSVARDHQAVRQLERWARENGLTPEVATP